MTQFSFKEELAPSCEIQQSGAGEVSVCQKCATFECQIITQPISESLQFCKIRYNFTLSRIKIITKTIFILNNHVKT